MAEVKTAPKQNENERVALTQEELDSIKEEYYQKAITDMQNQQYMSGGMYSPYMSGYGGYGQMPIQMPEHEKTRAYANLSGRTGRLEDTRYAATYLHDVGKLNKAALKESAVTTAEKLEDAVKRVERVIEEGQHEGNLSEFTLLESLEQLRALQQEFASAQREAGLISAEAERQEKLAEIMGANFADRFILKDEDGKIDSDKSSKAYDDFIKEAISHGFDYEEALDAIRKGAHNYVEKERENRAAKAKAKQQKEMREKGEPEDLVARVYHKDVSRKKAVVDVINSGVPAELIPELKKKKKESEIKNFQKGTVNGIIGRAFEPDYVFNFSKFEDFASQNKIFDTKLVIEQLQNVLESYWNDTNLAGFDSKEEFVQALTDGKVPGSIKDHFREKLVGVLKDRDEFVQELMNSREVLEILKIADNGGEDLAWKKFREKLDTIKSQGLIGGKEYNLAEEYFEQVLKEGVHFENAMIGFGMAVQDIVRKMIHEASDMNGQLSESRRADIAAITPDKILDRIRAERPDALPDRELYGGLQQYQYVEKIRDLELEKQHRLEHAKLALAQYEAYQPLDFTQMHVWDAQLRKAGNVLKFVLGGHDIKSLREAMMNNDYQLATAFIDYQQALIDHHDEIRKLKNQIAEEEEVTAKNLIDVIVEGYGFKRQNLDGLKSQLLAAKEKKGYFHGLSPTRYSQMPVAA